MQVSISEFKAKCTKIIHDVANLNQTIEITKRGKIVAIVSPPASPNKIDPHEFLDCLHGTVNYSMNGAKTRNSNNILYFN
jgi:antitoxin (DNA-binding transcriptional repressor) of toxin-antitoxin stability system